MSGSWAPPGWYQDPTDDRSWRWWDGSRWSEDREPKYLPAGPGSGRSLAELLEAEERAARWALYGVVVYGFGIVLVALIELAQAAAWQRNFHHLNVVLDQAGTPAYSSQKLPSAPRAGYAGDVFLAGGIPFLVWQFRAAELAGALRYPSAQTPGWGIGAWFVPIVNFFIP